MKRFRRARMANGRLSILAAELCFRLDDQSLMQTFFASVKNRSASKPPSLPTPDCFIPPKGVRRSRKSQQLTQIIPLFKRADLFAALDPIAELVGSKLRDAGYLCSAGIDMLLHQENGELF